MRAAGRGHRGLVRRLADQLLPRHSRPTSAWTHSACCGSRRTPTPSGTSGTETSAGFPSTTGTGWLCSGATPTSWPGWAFSGCCWPSRCCCPRPKGHDDEPGRDPAEASEGINACPRPETAGTSNNTGFLVSGNGVISIDATVHGAAHPRLPGRYQTRSRTQPVRTLVNTHHHGDHTHGNYLMGGATIVGHERCREAILNTPMPPPPGIWADVDWGHLKPAPPFLTYTDGVTLWSGDLRCEVRYVGTPRAHHERLDHLHPGTIGGLHRRPAVQRRHPVRDAWARSAAGSRCSRSCSARSAPRRWCPATARSAVPRSSTTCWPTCGSCRRQPEQAKAAGLSPLQAARATDLGEFKDLLDSERIVGNLHRAYLELDGAERGAPVDLVHGTRRHGAPITAASRSPKVRPWPGSTRKSRGCCASTPS